MMIHSAHRLPPALATELRDGPSILGRGARSARGSRGSARSPLPSPAAGLARPLSRDQAHQSLLVCMFCGGRRVSTVGQESRRKPCRCTDRAAAPEDRQPGLCWQVGQWRRALRSGRTWPARVFALSTGGPSPPDLLPTGEDGGDNRCGP